MKKKIYVLDTSVLIHNAESILKFQEHHRIVPLTCVQEMDGLKKGIGEVAYSARAALRLLDSLRNGKSLSQGVPVGNDGGDLQVIVNDKCLFLPNTPDNRIISCALALKREESKKPNGEQRDVILVTKDAGMRVVGEAWGLQCEDFRNDKSYVYEKYGKVLHSKNEDNGVKSIRYMIEGDSLFRMWGNGNIEKVKRKVNGIMGIKPKNIEQEALFDVLTFLQAKLIAVTGVAGCGKTLLAMAGALHLKEKKDSPYRQILISRPVMPQGRDLGFLPGTVEEKMSPYMAPIMDNLEVIIPSASTKKDNRDVTYSSANYLLDKGIVKVEPLTYIRGRSLSNAVWVVDESQNSTPEEMKCMVTRIGENCRTIFTGDLEQLDNPFLDAASSGLAYLISRFINEDDFCYINLKESARSVTAEKGARLL